MIKRLLSATLIALTITAWCQQEETRITHVRVLDPELKTICVVTNPSALEEMSPIWIERSTVEPSPRYTFTHKIDVTTKEGGRQECSGRECRRVRSSNDHSTRQRNHQ